MVGHRIATWAHQSDVIALSGCDNEYENVTACQIRFFLGPDGNPILPSIPMTETLWVLAWTPDDTRLLLRGIGDTLWVINVDGSGLSPVLGGASRAMILYDRGE